MTTFEPACSEEIKYTYPSLFREDALYFYIVKNSEIAGLYSIIDREVGNAEVFMTIFEKYRFKIINKSTLDMIINTPFELGFTQVWSWTRLASWIRLLQRLENIESIAPPFWDAEDTTKIWFRKGNKNVFWR